MPIQDSMVAPQAEPLQVALAPAQNAFHSLFLLVEADHLSGLGDWVTRVAGALTAEEMGTHALVFTGLHYAALPQEDWPSFPAYLDHLEALDPIVLRDKILDAYMQIPPLVDGERQKSCGVVYPVDLDVVLKDADSYLAFLKTRFLTHKIDEALERKAYRYVVDPAAMQALIVSHLRKMWTTYLAPEWQRVVPMLQDAVKAFEQVDFNHMPAAEVAEFVTGQDLQEVCWRDALADARRITFVPSAHVGPYLRCYCMGGKTFWILFGARLPEGSSVHAPDLSRTEIIVRLSALADETRLQVLRLIADEGELYSQEVMSRLDLSQSAASRHLKQLSATGYLTERRSNGAKCYSLNPKRVEDTLRAVSTFLLGK